MHTIVHTETLWIMSCPNMQQMHIDIENRWQNPGDVTDVPLLNLTQTNRFYFN